MTSFVPWPPQLRLFNGILDAIQRGRTRICGTLPTGGGKSWVICELVKHYLDMGKRTSTYTNRRLLIDQLVKTFNAAEIDHGIRAAGRVPDLDARCQISSIHTEHSRVVKRKQWDLHKADLVVIDESHLFQNPMAKDIKERHLAQGAVVVEITATPLDLERDFCEELVVGGVMSDLRACGACVPAIYYGCSEPDLKHIGKKAIQRLEAGEDLTERDNAKAIMVPGIFGNVFDEYQRLNPEGRPTILFAPGVGESLMFAEYFHSKGVSSAHIDGEEVWVNGDVQRSRSGNRSAIIEGTRTGSIRILCNRFVLREGIDCPWLQHGIFATVFGSLQSYLQSGGRLLRACAGKSAVTIQDHGGNWHRGFGSLNDDHHWQLGDTAKRISQGRIERLRAMDRDDGSRPPREPVCCPQCRMILVSWRCPCGFTVDPKKKSRPVIQADGTLIEMPGDVFVPRKTSMRSNTESLWQKVYWQTRNSKSRMTFSQALGYFYYQHHYYPPPTIHKMPKDPADIACAVADVAPEKLH